MKLPAGFSAPLHSHTADHNVVVVAGTLTMTVEGGAPKKLGPGSWFEFTGKKKHVTTCDAGADCVLFIAAKAAWDLVPAAAAKQSTLRSARAQSTRPPIASTTRRVPTASLTRSPSSVT
jgi:quercetin dioxygenase-like cupin family protein